MLHQALKALGSMGLTRYELLGVVHLGEACLIAGRLDDALTHAERALTIARDQGVARPRGVGATASRRGRLPSRSCGTGAGWKATTISPWHWPPSSRMAPLVAHCHLGLGRLYRRTGDLREGFLEHLSTADDDVPRDGHDVLAGEGGRPRVPEVTDDASRSDRFSSSAWALLAAPLAAETQPAQTADLIGIVDARPPSVPVPYGQAFRRGLADLGWVEGRNVVVESRYAEGRLERYPDSPPSWWASPVDVIVAGGARRGAGRQGSHQHHADRDAVNRPGRAGPRRQPGAARRQHDRADRTCTGK